MHESKRVNDNTSTSQRRKNGRSRANHSPQPLPALQHKQDTRNSSRQQRVRSAHHVEWLAALGRHALRRRGAAAAGAARGDSFPPISLTRVCSPCVFDCSRVASSSFCEHMSQPRREIRELLAGLPSRHEALQQQRANLVQFVADNRAAFDAMPYEPWTVMTAANAAAEDKGFEVRASNLPGLRGVFPLQAIAASSTPRRILFYPGLLLPDSLYQSFYKAYYCPTGLELPPLAYYVDGKRVGITIVGDPTSKGALINDGVFRHDDGQHNCTHCTNAATVARSLIAAFLSVHQIRL